MTSLFDVSPYDGGWCVKIADTGEVLFFSARRALSNDGAITVKLAVRGDDDRAVWSGSASGGQGV